MTRNQRLAALIAEQATDDQADRLERRPGETRECDLPRSSVGPTQLEAIVRSSRGRKKQVTVRGEPLRLLEGCTAWTMAAHALACAGLAPCPVCKGRTLAPAEYCAGCDRLGADRLLAATALPGEPVGMDGPTRYSPGSKLRGGMGARPARKTG